VIVNGFIKCLKYYIYGLIRAYFAKKDRMRNGLIIWNVVLTLVIGFLLFKQFGTGSKNGKSTTKADTKAVTDDGQFRMAYFEMDSIAANFEMVKEIKAELSKKEEDISREMETLARNFQQKYIYYQNLAREGKLSQAQSDSATEEIKRMDDQMKLRKQQLDQQYNDYMALRQNDIKTKIEAFLKEYNKKKNFSYIVSYEQGLFYYKDTIYNITADVIKGLNESYKSTAHK